MRTIFMIFWIVVSLLIESCLSSESRESTRTEDSIVSVSSTDDNLPIKNSSIPYGKKTKSTIDSDHDYYIGKKNSSIVANGYRYNSNEKELQIEKDGMVVWRVTFEKTITRIYPHSEELVVAVFTEKNEPTVGENHFSAWFLFVGDKVKIPLHNRNERDSSIGEYLLKRQRFEWIDAPAINAFQTDFWSPNGNYAAFLKASFMGIDVVPVNKLREYLEGEILAPKGTSAKSRGDMPNAHRFVEWESSTILLYSHSCCGATWGKRFNVVSGRQSQDFCIESNCMYTQKGHLKLRWSRTYYENKQNGETRTRGLEYVESLMPMFEKCMRKHKPKSQSGSFELKWNLDEAGRTTQIDFNGEMWGPDPSGKTIEIEIDTKYQENGEILSVMKTVPETKSFPVNGKMKQCILDIVSQNELPSVKNGGKFYRTSFAITDKPTKQPYRAGDLVPDGEYR